VRAQWTVSAASSPKRSHGHQRTSITTERSHHSHQQRHSSAVTTATMPHMGIGERDIATRHLRRLKWVDVGI
jgi:hypothetical protein